MAARDPETGQFVAGGAMDKYSDFEVFTATAHMDIDAADIDGTTSSEYPDGQNFEGFQLVDYDELVDRNEVLDLLRAQHALTVYGNSTGTEDGSIRGLVEISSAPTLQAMDALEPTGTKPIDDSDFNVNYRLYDTDSIDILGRVLIGHAGQPFSDTATGVGGAGSTGEDSYELTGFPEVIGRFHPRDELFINGALEASNIADAGIHIDVSVQHLYGVRSQ